MTGRGGGEAAPARGLVHSEAGPRDQVYSLQQVGWAYASRVAAQPSGSVHYGVSFTGNYGITRVVAAGINNTRFNADQVRGTPWIHTISLPPTSTTRHSPETQDRE